MLDMMKLHNQAAASEVLTTGVTSVESGECVQTEVNNLVQYTRNKIGSTSRAAFTEWANADMFEFDNFNDSTRVDVKYIDNRGEPAIKTQYLVQTLWAVITTAIAADRDNYVSTNIVERSIKNWVENDKPVLIPSKAPLKMNELEIARRCKQMITSLQDRGVLGTDIVRRVEQVLDADGKQVYRDGKPQEFNARFYTLTPEFELRLEDLTSELQDAAVMTCRPMTHQPEDWTGAKSGIAKGAGIRLIKAKFQPHSVPRSVLSAVNKLQAVKFVISPVLGKAGGDMRACNKSLTASMSELFSSKELKNEEFDRYAEVQRRSGDEVYFPITMDSRGRMIYRGGIIQPQGTDFCKATFQFANKVALGKSGLKAIYVHTANCFGLSGASIKQRVSWVTKHLAVITRCTSHWHVRKNFKGANVFQALAAADELRKIEEWKAAGNKTQAFMSGLVCHQDGTCNGLQHAAAITKDRPTAETVNCVAANEDDTPADAYNIVAQSAMEGAAGHAARVIAKYGRDIAKNPLMIKAYGAGEATLRRNITKFLTEKGEELSIGDLDLVGDAIVNAISVVAAGVDTLTDAIHGIMDGMLRDRAIEVDGNIQSVKPSVKWKTADGFIASTEYREDEMFLVREGSHAVRIRGCGKAPIDLIKTKYSMSPNLIHSIDATHLRMVINKCDHDLVTVHDSIGSHAGNYFATAKAIREEFVNVHRYDTLGNLCENIKQPTPQFEGDYDVSEALMSPYIFS